MSSVRRWIIGSGLTVAAGLASLVAAEVAIRFLAPQPTGVSYQDPYGLAMHVPGLRTYLPQYGQRVSFNSAGMRDREHSIAPAPGVFRILLLGDSFMEALQVPFDSSLAPGLERALTTRTGQTVEVINAGVSGWGTDDELRYLQKYGVGYRPDLVLVAMTLHNDISDNLRQEWHSLASDTLVEGRPRAYGRMEYKVVQVKAYLASRFQLYQLWRKVRHGREIRRAGTELRSHVVDLNLVPPPERITAGLRLTSLLLERIRETTSSNGARLAVVLLPLRFQLSDSAYADFVHEANRPAEALPFGKPQRDVTAMAERLGIPVIDLLPGFRAWTAASATPLFLARDGHWTSMGHHLAADLVADQLVADSLVP